MVKKLLSNSAHFLNLPQGDILSAGFIIMVLSLTSGLFGLVRDRLLAAQFTPDLTGIYFASFVIPDNILQVLILSAVSSAFIPVFTRFHNNEEQWELVQSVLKTSLLFFSLVIVLCIIFMPFFAQFLVPGIQKENPEHLLLFVNLTRIILVSQLFFVVSYLFTGILQSYQRFVVPASAGLFYNIGIILGILFFAPRFGMYGVGIGVLIGTFLHLAIQIPFIIKIGFRLSWNTTFLSKGVKEIIHLMIPRAFSTAMERLNFTVETALASVVSLSSIAYLNFASHVAVFPVTLVAAAIGQAALPFFARAVTENDMESFKKHLMQSLTHIVFLLAPASVLLIVFHTPVVRLIFGTRFFSWESTVLTAQTLAVLAIGLLAQGASNILARGFYALYDTRTPLILSVISLLSSLSLSLLFILYFHFDVRFLALSTSLGAWINAVMLLYLLHKKIGDFAEKKFLFTITKIFSISVMLFCFSYTLFKMLEGYFNTNYTIQLFIFTAITVVLSGIFYLLLSAVFNLEEYKELFSLLKKAGNVQKRFVREVLVANEQQ